MAHERLKHLLGEQWTARVKALTRSVRYRGESLWGGGSRREALLAGLLRLHYESRFRREWVLSEEQPHFFDQRLGFFSFGFTPRRVGPYSFYRGFYSSEVIRNGDTLLDIGCGDGFFTMRFFSGKCSHVDAIDIESSAIAAATKKNAADNIDYQLMDAVTEPFPRSAYDVVVWDGALGHFAPGTANQMLQKIAVVLKAGGIFVGSESLGREGHDHLQFFETVDDLGKLMKPHFRHIQLRSVEYPIGTRKTFLRKEAFWRCANDEARLLGSSWANYPTGS